jgi:hypothetical protein
MTCPDTWTTQTCPCAQTPDGRGRTALCFQGARQQRWTAGQEKRWPRGWRPSETNGGNGPRSSALASTSPKGENAPLACQYGQRKWDKTSDAPCWKPLMHHHAPHTATDADRKGEATQPSTRSSRPGAAPGKFESKRFCSDKRINRQYVLVNFCSSFFLETPQCGRSNSTFLMRPSPP